MGLPLAVFTGVSGTIDSLPTSVGLCVDRRRLHVPSSASGSNNTRIRTSRTSRATAEYPRTQNSVYGVGCVCVASLSKSHQHQRDTLATTHHLNGDLHTTTHLSSVTATPPPNNNAQSNDRPNRQAHPKDLKREFQRRRKLGDKHIHPQQRRRPRTGHRQRVHPAFKRSNVQGRGRGREGERGKEERGVTNFGPHRELPRGEFY